MCVCVCVCFFGRVDPEGGQKTNRKDGLKGCVVGCGFHGVVTVCPHGGRNPKNQTKIHRSLRHGLVKDAPGTTAGNETSLSK